MQRFVSPWRVLSVVLLAAITLMPGCVPVGGSPAGDRFAAAEPRTLANAGEHPHLLFRKSDIPRIRQAIDAIPEARRQWESVVERTDPEAGIKYPVPGALTQPDWAAFALRGGRFAADCGFLYQMTGDLRYARAVRDMLLTCAREFDTRISFELCGDYRGTEVGHAAEGGNTMGYFFCGQLLTSTAAGYDCVWETLTPDERREIENGFFRRCVATIESYDHSRRIPAAAPDFMVNGGQWNGANLCNEGLTAVGFTLNEPRLYERGVRNFKLYLSRDMLADGFWIEEDTNYSDICMTTLFEIAWMARSSGYPEDLFNTVVHALPDADYDARYFASRPSCDGPAPAGRSLRMYLDAQLGYQYPNFAPGNWGWTPGRGALRRSNDQIGMLTAGWDVWGDPAYAFALRNVDLARSMLGTGVTSLLYFGRPLGDAPPPPSRSRWYPHARWLVLKSVEGPDYWNSDALYVFMPCGTGRNKGNQPLTLDLFAFGRSVAPRNGLRDQAQNLTKDYQLTEPAWNGLLVDGCNFSTFRQRADRAWMAWHDFGPLAKVASPRIHSLGERRAELDMASVERHPEEDRTSARTLALTDRYLVDVCSVAFDRPPAWKHNFDYVLHGVGKLTIENDSRLATLGSWTAVWTQDDGGGLRSTFLSAGDGGGTKINPYSGNRDEFVIASRGGFDARFVVVHEPVRDKSQIASITRVADESGVVALEIVLADGTIDQLALRIDGSTEGWRWNNWEGRKGNPFGLDGNYVFVRTHADGRIERQER